MFRQQTWYIAVVVLFTAALILFIVWNRGNPVIQDLPHSTYTTLYDYENVDAVFRFMNGNLDEIKVTIKRDSSSAYPDERVIPGTSTYQVFRENQGLRVERFNYFGSYKEEFRCKDLNMESPEDFAGSNLFLTDCGSERYRIFLGIAA